MRKNDVNSCCLCLSPFTHETISTLLIEGISRMRVTYRRSSVARCEVSVAQWQGIRARNPKIWCTITDEDVGFFFCPTPETRRMNIFLQSLSNLIYPLFCVLLILFFVQEGVMLSGLISPCFFSFIGKFHCIIMIFAFFWLRSPRSSDFKLRP